MMPSVGDVAGTVYTRERLVGPTSSNTMTQCIFANTMLNARLDLPGFEFSDGKDCVFKGRAIVYK